MRVEDRIETKIRMKYRGWEGDVDVYKSGKIFHLQNPVTVKWSETNARGQCNKYKQ